jgi:hypothetical protein
MDWTETGALPPTFTLPTITGRVFFRFISKGMSFYTSDLQKKQLQRYGLNKENVFDNNYYIQCCNLNKIGHRRTQTDTDIKNTRYFTACPYGSVWACRVEASREAWSVANLYNRFRLGRVSEEKNES